MPPIRTIASRWAEFEVGALSEATREDRTTARFVFYSAALSMLDMLSRVPPGEAPGLVRALRVECHDFYEKLVKEPPK